MKKVKRALALLFVLALVVSCFAGCKKKTEEPQNGTTTTTDAPKPTDAGSSTTTTTPAPDANVTDAPVEPVDPVEEYWCNEFDVMTLASKEYGTDYESLYDHVGKEITIADVQEDPDTGFGYIEVDGELHLLGLDFLSFAMVYNNEPAGEYKTADDVYAAWWRLYITRWNALLPEVPLYSNE